MADEIPLPHSMSAADDGDTITVTIGGPYGDRVLAEVRGVQRQFGLAPSEAIAMLVGYGIAAMREHGLIGGRFSAPMSRAEMLEQIRAMVEEQP